jgi:hypothetical protein
VVRQAGACAETYGDLHWLVEVDLFLHGRTVVRVERAPVAEGEVHAEEPANLDGQRVGLDLFVGSGELLVGEIPLGRAFNLHRIRQPIY